MYVSFLNRTSEIPVGLMVVRFFSVQTRVVSSWEAPRQGLSGLLVPKSDLVLPSGQVKVRVGQTEDASEQPLIDT